MVHSAELMGYSNFSIKNTFLHIPADAPQTRKCERSQTWSGFAMRESWPVAADKTQCDWGEMVSPWVDQHEDPCSELATAGGNFTEVCDDPMMWPQAKQERERQEFEPTAASDTDGQFITAMIKNIPSRCTCQDVIDAIDSLGFQGIYNFFYLPIRCRKEMKGFGFAFIGFPDAYLTKQFQAAMTGYRFTSRNSPKVVEIVRARIQGLDDCVAHFKSTRTLNSRQSPIFINDGKQSLWQVL